MGHFRWIAVAILTLDAAFTASVALASPQSSPDAARSNPIVVPQAPRGGRVVANGEQGRWLSAIDASGVRPYLTKPEWDGRGFYARAIDLRALLDFLNGQLIDSGRGLFRRGVLHREHRDVGPRRLDYRTDRGVLGEGSMQLVVSRITGFVFIDMDAFSPYEDTWSFVGHMMEVLKNRFRISR